MPGNSTPSHATFFTFHLFAAIYYIRAIRATKSRAHAQQRVYETLLCQVCRFQHNCWEKRNETKRNWNLIFFFIVCFCRLIFVFLNMQMDPMPLNTCERYYLWNTSAIYLEWSLFVALQRLFFFVVPRSESIVRVEWITFDAWWNGNRYWFILGSISNVTRK